MIKHAKDGKELPFDAVNERAAKNGNGNNKFKKPNNHVDALSRSETTTSRQL